MKLWWIREDRTKPVLTEKGTPYKDGRTKTEQLLVGYAGNKRVAEIDVRSGGWSLIDVPPAATSANSALKDWVPVAGDCDVEAYGFYYANTGGDIDAAEAAYEKLRAWKREQRKAKRAAQVAAARRREGLP